MSLTPHYTNYKETDYEEREKDDSEDIIKTIIEGADDGRNRQTVIISAA